MTDRDPSPNFRLTEGEISAIYEKAAADKKPFGLSIVDAIIQLYIDHWILAKRQQHHRGIRQIRMRKNQPRRNLKC